MGKKLDKIVEGYKPIPMKRMFYPRKFNLSEDFVNAFHREYDRLVGEGLNPKSLVERFGKAMRFHQNETRRYHQLDEKGKIGPDGKADAKNVKEGRAMNQGPMSGKQSARKSRQQSKRELKKTKERQPPAVDPETRDAQEDEHGNSRIT